MIMTDICIVYVNYYHRDDIDRSLASIERDRKDTYDVHVLVIDNSLDADNVKDMLSKKYPYVQYVMPERNLGFAGGNNRGFAACDARYYFCLNGDTEFIEGTNTLARIIDFMDRHSKVGMIAPKLIGMDGIRQNSCYRFDFGSIFVKPLRQLGWHGSFERFTVWSKRLQMEDFGQDRTQPIDWALGAALVARREAIEDVGYMDERYFLYLEDCDWCRTFWEYGWPVYFVHDIVIKHRHDRASSRVPGLIRALLCNTQARIHVISWCKYLRKWGWKHRYFGRVK